MISAKHSLFPLILLFIFMILLTSCGKSTNSSTPSNTDEPSTTITTPSDDNQTTKEDETANMKVTLKIDDTEVDVIWTDNDSVRALKNLAKNGLTINMSKYGVLIASCSVMFENYNIYNLSSTKCVVAINPFFRLYHSAQVAFLVKNNNGERFTSDKPDIWPDVIQNKELFDVPVNKYSHSLEPLSPYAPDDEFIYKPKVLTEEDIVYINTLMLFQTKDIIGFNDSTKIIDSISYFVWYSANFNSVKYSRQPLNEVMNNLVDNVVNSPFRDLFSYCVSKGGVNKTEFIFLFEKLLSYIYKDFNENPYICEYYLNTPEETANC